MIDRIWYVFTAEFYLKKFSIISVLTLWKSCVQQQQQAKVVEVEEQSPSVIKVTGNQNRKVEIIAAELEDTEKVDKLHFRL